jgi:pimeloyl-ACP methyl ester carboxylesterase
MERNSRRLDRYLILMALVASLMAASPYDYDPSPYLHPQRLVDIGGRRMNIYCFGRGSPAVILEAGLGDWIHTWRFVQPAVAHKTQVCSYDRAGMGFSDFAPPPRDATVVVSDLYRLLSNAHIRAPYVVVGSSVGGLYAQLFVDRYPSDVAGFVLVDPAELHNWDFRTLAPAVSNALAAWRRQSALCLAAVQRAPLEPSTKIYHDCVPAAADIASACKAGPGFCVLAKQVAAQNATRSYIIDFVSEQHSWGTKTASEVLSNKRSLGSMPLVVLTGARTFEDMAIPESQKVAAEKLWIQMHVRLAALSSRGKNVVVEGSGHVIQFDKPSAVVSAIETVVDQVREAER